MKYKSVTAVLQVDSDDATKVRINFSNGITKDIPSFIYPEYADLTALYAAIVSSEISLNELCYLEGFLKKVTQDDIDDAEGVIPTILFNRPAAMSVGNEDQLLVAESSDPTSLITFTSSNNTIANIVDGDKLKANALGVVTITAQGTKGEVPVSKRVPVGDFGTDTIIESLPNFVDRFNISDPTKVISSGGLISEIIGVNNNLSQPNSSLQPSLVTSGGPNNRQYLNSYGKTIFKDFDTPLTFPMTYYVVMKQVSQNGSTFGGNNIIDCGIGSETQIRQAKYTVDKPYLLFRSGGYSMVGYVEDWCVISGIFWNQEDLEDYVRINNEPKTEKWVPQNNVYPWSGFYIAEADVNIADIVLFQGKVSDINDKDIIYTLMKYHKLTSLPSLVALGDSIVYGQNSTPMLPLSLQYGYTQISAFDLNKILVNIAIPGAYMARDNSQGIDFFNQYPNLFQRPATDNTWLLIAFMTNDARDGGNIDGSTTIYPPDGVWKAKAKTGIEDLIDFGYDPSQIIIGTAPYMDGYTTMPQYVEICREIAEELGCVFMDNYANTLANGGQALLDDGTHPNDAGHEVSAIHLKSIIS